MEIPESLKHLYQHWEHHTLPQKTRAQIPDLFIDPHLFKEISFFIEERMRILEKKTTHATPPYTQNPILSAYRFCNIFREFDRQTIAFHTLLYTLRDNFPLWLLNMFMCRMIARTETIERIGLLSFDAQENAQWYTRLMQLPLPRYGNAYVFPISAIQRGPTPTRELFLAKHLPLVMQNIAAHMRTWSNVSLYDGVAEILPLFGYRLSFLWTEALIDTAYQFPTLLTLFDRFPIGPGSAPTLKRINPSIDPSLLVQRLSHLCLTTSLTFHQKPVMLSAENWEGIGCEFRKYTHLAQGKGRRRPFTAS